MSNLTVHNITNNFPDVRLASLATWKQAAEFTPCDRGGPYVVMPEGYDPEDLKFILDEFVLGRSGKWLSLGLFYRLPVPERRAEFVLGTAAEVMTMMSNLPPKVQIVRPGVSAKAKSTPAEADEMAEALRAAKAQPPSAAS